MKVIKRLVDIRLPLGQSAFLWGPRKTGKSTYLKAEFSQSIYYDFLKTDLFLEFLKNPALLRQQLLSQKPEKLKFPIILDEVQKVPQILDEVHWLIENKNFSFILCGSSARKLKKGKANLLGGRAWRYEMFPLVSKEIENFQLLRALNHGLIPDHYFKDNYKKSLQSYVQDYLKEEVFAEGLTRNIPAFSRFFDSMAYSHGELTNYSNIARDCGVDAKTVKEYYYILVDTLLGSFVEPFKKRQSRRVISQMSKFYLFDVGIAGSIIKRVITDTKGDQFGNALEHFIFTEMNSYRLYKENDFCIRFWRTKSGLEVDFILGDGDVAIEVKSTARVDNRKLYGIRTFSHEYSPRRSIVVCNEKQKRIVEGVEMIPIQQFLKELWTGKII